MCFLFMLTGICWYFTKKASKAATTKASQAHQQPQMQQVQPPPMQMQMQQQPPQMQVQMQQQQLMPPQNLMMPPAMNPAAQQPMVRCCLGRLSVLHTCPDGRGVLARSSRLRCLAFHRSSRRRPRRRRWHRSALRTHTHPTPTHTENTSVVPAAPWGDGRHGAGVHSAAAGGGFRYAGALRYPHPGGAGKRLWVQARAPEGRGELASWSGRAQAGAVSLACQRPVTNVRFLGCH